MDPVTLKELKEAFVTGHSGTTPTEIFLVCLSAPLGIFLFNLAHHVLRKSRGSKIPKQTLVVIESIVLLLPMALCQTNLLYPWGRNLLGVEGIVAACLHFWCRIRFGGGEMDPSPASDERMLPFLSSYRSTVSYLTFVAILAVDFHVFPRRFAKTETRGYGLMDLGAGSFVVSGGFVSWHARRSRRSGATGKLTYWSALKPVVVRSAPLLVVGLIRLATNKGLEYQEHVSEYGVHWNFFFTLAVVGILSTMFRHDTEKSTGHGSWNVVTMVFPWILLALHQTALSLYGIQDYIEDAPRQCQEPNGIICNFVAANREGILGSIGYICMQLISEDIAHYCLWSPERSARRGERLSLCCALMWLLHWMLESVADIETSRRSTNATFVVWTIAHNTTVLLLIWAAFFFVSPFASVSPTFDSANRHGLIVFILANLMTGLVNLTINTLEVSDTQALAIIFLYLFSVGSVALAIDWVFMRLRGKPTKEKVL